MPIEGKLGNDRRLKGKAHEDTSLALRTLPRSKRFREYSAAIADTINHKFIQYFNARTPRINK